MIIDKDNTMKCKFCQSLNIKKSIKTIDYNRAITQNIFEYYKCKDCKSVYLDKIPEDLPAYYGDGYSVYQSNTNTVTAPEPSELDKLNTLKKFKLAGAILEIGPGAGAFLKLTKANGFNVAALELDQGCVDKLTKEGLDVIKTNDPAVDIGKFNRKFDAVVAWHVFEHLPNLVDLINNLKNNINDNGVVLVSLPNPRSLSFSLFKRYWVHLDGPRHVSIISKAALIALMKKQKFTYAGALRGDALSKVHNQAGWVESATIFIDNIGAHYFSLPSIVKRILIKPIWLARKMLVKVENIANREATYTLAFHYHG
jgi:2-polyprenyl-3-methyl-5-hydroxy-6-metoxy-1,4-benzoquinol methylase